jgi:hypothetical protein
MGFISGLFKNKNQKYLENLKKNNKIQEEEEQEKTEIFTIGKVDKEIHEKKDIEGALAQGSEEMKAIRASREKELKAIQDQLFIINEAKVKFGPHIGTFKVLSDTPTIQSKTVGTEIEKSLANFTFVDGFQLLSLTQWQDIGTGKYQDNLALIKKSTIMGTGKMPPANAPIESGKIEFIDSGQINVPENIDTTGMPIPPYIPTPKVIDFYLTDKHNNRLESVDYGTFVYLHIKTVGYIGKTISVDMNNEKADYLLSGERLEKDVLKDYLVQSNEEIIELEVVEPLK